MSDATAITVDVLHALPDRVERVVLRLPAGATVAQALSEPEVLIHFPDAKTLPVGIFSQRCEPERVLRNGDRIELYRPLIADPKEARRERAAKS